MRTAPTRPVPSLRTLLRGLVFLARVRAAERRFRWHARRRQHHQAALGQHLDGMAAEIEFRAWLCDQRMRTRGVCIDMADSRMDDDMEGRTDLTAEDEEAQFTLDRVAAQALVLWDLLDGLDTVHAARLRPKLWILLKEVGQIIASEMTADPVEPSSEGGGLH
jgi:hypothetical protein